MNYDPHTHAATGDPHTSHEAAAKAGDIARSHTERIREVIRNELFDQGVTKTDIVRLTGLTDVQVGRRLLDLVKAGIVHRNGSTRVNDKGNAELCHFYGPGPDPEPEPDPPKQYEYNIEYLDYQAQWRRWKALGVKKSPDHVEEELEFSTSTHPEHTFRVVRREIPPWSVFDIRPSGR